MIINDPVYGTSEISSPVVLALIATPAFQRLKGISQFGMPNRYYHIDSFSRYEHSVGVYLLLRILEASEEEQIAGLLHDVSHTAFSHVVDWAIGDQMKEDFQDNRHASVLNEPGIADVLRSHGFDPNAIADYHRFGMLEKSAPDVCADRIEYACREFEPGIAQLCLPHMRGYRGEIVFTDERGARTFADNFLRKQIEHWGGYEAMTRYVLFAAMLRQALAAGDVTMDDLLKDDEYVIAKLLATGNAAYAKTLKVMEQKDLSDLPKAPKAMSKKFRHVNPRILKNDTVVRLTEIDPEFAQRLEEAREESTRGFAPGVLE